MPTSPRNLYIYIMAMALITALTWSLGLIDFKYKLVSNAAFANGFPGDSTQWQRAGNWSNIEISDDKISVVRNGTDRSYAKRNFELPGYDLRAEHKLRVRGTIHTKERVESPDDDRGAAYMIWLEDAKGDVLQYLTIQDLTGERDIYHAERIVSIPDAVRSFTLVLNSRDSNSSFSLTDASAQVISVTPYYKLVSILLLVCWLVLIAVCGRWLLKYATTPLFLAAGLLVVSIIVGVMLPESVTTHYVDPLFRKLAQNIPVLNSNSAEITYKIGHFLFFFLVSFILFFKSETLPINHTLLLCLLILLAVASEGMQLHLFNRSTRLFDLAVDIGGIVLAWCLVSVFTNSRKA